MGKDLEDRDEQLRQKEKKIFQYKQKIADLEKSKHVLSFRTNEMRKNLDPKEAQLEKLKEDFFKLDSDYKEVFKKLKSQEDKNEKLQI